MSNIKNKSQMRSLIDEYADEIDVALLLADGFDDAIVGVAWGVDSQPHVTYDKEKMLLILINRDSMTVQDASEYLDFNVFGAYVGENSPMYIDMLL